MERLTRKTGNKDFYITDNLVFDNNVNGYTGEPINKLAKYENMYDNLIARQNQIPKELEFLRNKEKTKSVRFRELMVEKMTIATILNLFKTYGLQ